MRHRPSNQTEKFTEQRTRGWWRRRGRSKRGSAASPLPIHRRRPAAGSASGGEGRRQVRRGEEQPGRRRRPRPSPSVRRRPGLPRRPEADGRVAGGGRAWGLLGAGAEGSRGSLERRVGRDPQRRCSERLAGGGSRAVPVTEQWRPRSVSGPSGTLATCRVCEREGAGVGPGSCAADPGSLTVLAPWAGYFRVRIWLRKQGRKTVAFGAILTLHKRTGQTPT